MSVIKGYPEKIRDIDVSTVDQYATAEPIREKQIGQSVLAHQFVFVVGADAVEALSSAIMIVATAHAAKAGDIIHFTSGTLSGQEVKVLKVTANAIYLAESLSVAPTALDAFNILRHKYPVVDSAGVVSVSASYTPSPILFTRDGADQEVVEDTVVPANNRPLPVKLVAASGDINITAGDLNVSLSSANDSVEIIQTTHDDVNVNANMQIGDADVGVANPVPVSDNGASLTIDNANIDAALSTLATEATLGDIKTAVEIIDNAISGSEMQVDIVSDLPLASGVDSVDAVQSGTWDIADITGTISLPTGAATEASLSSIDGKITACNTGAVVISSELPAGTQNIGDVDVASLPGTVAADITAIKTAVEIIDNAISGSEMQVDVLTMPAVEQAEDDVLEFIRNDYSSTPVTTGAYVQLIASTSAAVKQLEIFDSSGQTLVLALGAGGSEADKMYIVPGGNGRIPCAIPASSRISIKAVSADATVGEIVINLIG